MNAAMTETDNERKTVGSKAEELGSWVFICWVALYRDTRFRVEKFGERHHGSLVTA